MRCVFGSAPYQKQASTVRNEHSVFKKASWGTRRIFRGIRFKKQAFPVRKGHSVRKTDSCGTRASSVRGTASSRRRANIKRGCIPWKSLRIHPHFLNVLCPGPLKMRRVPQKDVLRTRISVRYQRRGFPVPNITPVPEKVLRQISCCQVKQVWKILIQRSRSEARPYILLLIYFILLFRPSISPLLIEYFMAFLMGEMSRWTLFTKLTTSP